MNKIEEAVKVVDMYIHILEHHEDIEMVEAFKTCREAVEKQETKKVVEQGYIEIGKAVKISGKCPVCKELILYGNYCIHCGQKLDWE